MVCSFDIWVMENPASNDAQIKVGGHMHFGAQDGVGLQNSHGAHVVAGFQLS
jgi:hypothetical protein